MKAENSFTGGQKREGIMFEEFNASAKCFPSAVNLYLKEHFCLISTVMELSKSININPEYPFKCYLMKIPGDRTATEF